MTSLKNKLYDVGIRAISNIPFVGDEAHRELNREAINHFASATKARPRAFSLWSPVQGPKTFTDVPNVNDPEYVTDYTSWPGLTNKRWSGRHLPPAPRAYVDALPSDAPAAGEPYGRVTRLYARRGAMIPSRSSLLFMFFAQWFTDSILRTDPIDRRKNTSTHDIDLCQIYGLAEETTRILREMKGGRMLTQTTPNGEELMPYLCEKDASGEYVVKEMYRHLPSSERNLDVILSGFTQFKPSRKEKLYATGLDRGNQSIGYVTLSTIFVREHNRIARELEKQNPTWNDERIFQTARCINIVIEMKLIVEEYINHILGHKLFKLDPSFAEEQQWYRANWIAVEFDMLYRWHGLAPDAIPVDGTNYQPTDFRNNNALFEQVGIGKLLDAVSTTRAGRIGLGNTPNYLWPAEAASIKMGRDFKLQPYNRYRERFGLDPLGSFDDLTDDADVKMELEGMYKSIDNLEYIVGVFAEKAQDGLLFGDLLNRMVAYDAFTQIFSNPLLSTNVYNRDTFTDYGLDLIEKTTSLEVLVGRNVQGGPFTAKLGVPDDG